MDVTPSSESSTPISPRSSEAPDTPGAPAADRPVLRALRRPVVAALVLLLVYLGAFMLTNPQGSLSSDIGSKVAALQAAEDNGGWDIDVGYWAEDADPDGQLHPLYDSRHIGDSWIPVSTLPLLVPAAPLWAIGGYRAVVLLAMIGSVATAFAARAIARRLGSADGWSAYWLVGLVSPVVIYALVFWEHSTGLALMAWAVVLLLDLMQGRRSWPAALGAGLLFGAAATMRTEALLYGALATALVLLRMLVVGGPTLRNLRRLVGFGLLSFAGVATLWVANDLLERAWLGAPLREARAAGAAGDAGVNAASRLDEGYKTLLGLNRLGNGLSDALLGLLFVVPLVVGVILLNRRRDRLVPVVLILVSWLLLASLFYDGLQFIPGLFTASPLAVFGLVAMWRSWDRRVVGGVALVAVPGVLWTSYLGGGVAQWGGRYLLVSGLLLVVLATLDLKTLGRWGAGALIATAAAVTLFGLAWMVERSNALADFGEVVRDRPEPVVVSGLAFQFREIGAFYEDGRYLIVPRATDLPTFEDTLRELDIDEFAFIQLDDGESEPLELDGYVATTSDSAEFLPGADVNFIHYEAVP